MKTHYLVFDIESVGLHGEGFAVGWVVLDEVGAEVESGRLTCPVATAAGDDEGRAWVSENVPDFVPTDPNPRAVREKFWAVWERWRERAYLVADCGWPVEARFLLQCVDDEPATRTWHGPYPLHDLASVLWAVGRDPLESYPREPDELPEHDPLADARQSARLLVGVLDG